MAFERRTSLWIGRLNEARSLVRLPRGVRNFEPTRTWTERTRPSSEGKTWVTLHSGHESAAQYRHRVRQYHLRRDRETLIATWFFSGRIEGIQSENETRTVMLTTEHDAKVCENTSLEWQNPPGGEMTTFDFNVKRWFGVNGWLSGSLMFSRERGRLLTIAMTSYSNVRSPSSSSCLLWVERRPASTERTTPINRS